MAGEHAELTSGRRLARNVLWNLLGAGAPLLVAIIAIPWLIEGLGTERFGVLTLAWAIVGHFSLFDLGLGRALTKLVAERLGAGRAEDIPGLAGTALALTGALGVLGAAVLAVLSPWLVGAVLRIPVELRSETLTAFYLLGASIPIVITSAGLRGILEAHQRFDLVNAVRIPLGMLTFLGPAAVLPFSSSLVPVVATLVAARLISWVVHAVLCLRVAPSLYRAVRLRCALVRPLLSFGGWMTVSNVVGPVMAYSDRFLIAGTLSIAAVAYYATPYEVATRLWILPGALMGVLFPAFAASYTVDLARTARLLERAVNYTFLALFPLVLITVTLAHEGLTLWIGAEFAHQSGPALQLLAAGVLVNSLAHAPYGLIQAAGRPDLTAKLHLAELPFYLVALWWLVGEYGITGAAVAFVARVAVDAAALFTIARRLMAGTSPFTPRLALATGTALLVLLLGALIPGLAGKGVFLVAVLLLYLPATWFLVLPADDRALIRSRLKPAPVLD